MRLLQVTDTHLGTSWPVRGAPPGWSRHGDHLAALRLALGPALRGEVDLVVHSGDLFDRSRPPRRAVADAEALLEETARRVPVWLMPGNHDRHGLIRHLARPIRGLTVVDRPTRLVSNGVALAMVPFQRTAEAFAVAARQAAGAGVDAWVAHQAFHGAAVPNRVGSFVFREGEQIDTIGARHLAPGTRYVLCGHLHPRQRIRLAGAEIVCPGSTERTAFSEADQTKGAALWTFDARVEARWLDVPTRPLQQVAVPDDVVRVQAGALVRVHDPTLVDAVLAQGGFVVGRPGPRAPAPESSAPLPANPTRQLAMF